MLLCLVFLTLASSAAGITPVLKYKNAGTFGSWCEESYYSSPKACDIDGDGKTEIIYASYGVVVLDGATGKIEWRVNSGYDVTHKFVEIGGNSGHTWSDVEIFDIDADGKKEIIYGDSGGMLSVLDGKGYFKQGFPVKLPGPVRSVTVCDIDSDGKGEIIAGLGIAGGKSVYVYEHDGSLRNGWPQLDSMQNAETNPTDYMNNGWGYGVFGDGICAKDINGDGITEILVPTDLAFLSVYTPDGKLVKANALYGGRTWGKVPFYEDPMTEIRLENEGWGYTYTPLMKREDLYRMELGHAGVAAEDLDGDGKIEIAVAGIMANRKNTTLPPTEYMSLFVLNSDRTRYKKTVSGKLFDWTHIPTDLGFPLVQNKQIITSKVEQKLTVADVDGDGLCEMLFASYNGKLHCFSLDGTEHGAFPFSLTKRTSALYEYATTPEVCDLDGDGSMEVVFASFYDDTAKPAKGVNGSLYILNKEGKLVNKTALPDSCEAVFNNGSMAKPLVFDVDGDGKKEIAVNTLHGCICVFDV